MRWSSYVVVTALGRTTAAFLLVMASLPIHANAQTDATQSEPAIKRWSISWGQADPMGGPASQLEAAMRNAGFDDEAITLLGSTLNHPYSARGFTITSLLREYQVTYLRSDHLAFEIVQSKGWLGHTTGYKKDFLMLLLDSNVTILAPVVSLRFGEHARVGVGPLVAWTKVNESAPRPEPEDYRSVKGGAIASAALESSPRRRIYIGLTASYRWIAPVTVGPFAATSFGSTATLPAMTLNLSYATVGFSLGLRF